ncbi:hypothetical protein ES708_17949 [subsurface metagenome]
MERLLRFARNDKRGKARNDKRGRAHNDMTDRGDTGDKGT